MDDYISKCLKIKNIMIQSSRKPPADKGTTEFDTVIGHIEDLLVGDQLFRIQKNYLERFWPEFEDSEENKHTYMKIFIDYTNAIEDHLTNYLKDKIPGFSMEIFIDELCQRKNELDGEVFEVLFTMTDFIAFKEMFLDYKKMKLTGELDLTTALCISPISALPD